MKKSLLLFFLLILPYFVSYPEQAKVEYVERVEDNDYALLIVCNHGLIGIEVMKDLSFLKKGDKITVHYWYHLDGTVDHSYV